MPTNMHISGASRRKFLISASAAIASITSTPASALPFLRAPKENAPAAEPRVLLMVNQRTGEIFHEEYFNGQVYAQDALESFAQFARDLRTGEVGHMDPLLLDLATDLQSLAGEDEPLILTHGFRSSAGAARRGAANSHHLHGRALDIAHPRLGPRELHQHAAQLQRGGLARYRSFIHIDTGPTRRW